MKHEWTDVEVLSELRSFRRVDNRIACDEIALAGDIPGHVVHLSLSGNPAGVIAYDLEDHTQENGEWDNAVERGQIHSAEELRVLCARWLRRGGGA